MNFSDASIGSHYQSRCNGDFADSSDLTLCFVEPENPNQGIAGHGNTSATASDPSNVTYGNDNCDAKSRTKEVLVHCVHDARLWISPSIPSSKGPLSRRSKSSGRNQSPSSHKSENSGPCIEMVLRRESHRIGTHDLLSL